MQLIERVPHFPLPLPSRPGFLRFLQLVARWPWRLKPLVVDPAAELKEADRRALRSRFDARRAAGAGAAGGGDTGPALYLCTPRDRESQHWWVSPWLGLTWSVPGALVEIANTFELDYAITCVSSN